MGRQISTHVMGASKMNGIGGSGDYMRNGYLTIFLHAVNGQKRQYFQRCANGNACPTIPSMIPWCLLPNRALPIYAACRLLNAPKLIIEKCAHPDYKAQLLEYLQQAQRKNAHMPVDLTHAFDMQAHYEKYGTMKI